jgi:hypothetical protein
MIAKSWRGLAMCVKSSQSNKRNNIMRRVEGVEAEGQGVKDKGGKEEVQS